MACCLIVAGGGVGSAPYGSMPIGSVVAEGAFGICNARAVAANQVLVELVGDFGTPLPCDPNGPLNRRNWDLDALNPAARTRLVQFAEFVEPSSILLTLDGVLCPEQPYRLRSLVAEDGCDFVDFDGLRVDPLARDGDVRIDDGFIRDIANPQLKRDAVMAGRYLALGTYEITDTGDLARDFGVRSLRKRLLRRAMTAVGEFFHLAGYGTELEVKRLLRPDTLRRVQEKLRVQCIREPEVVDAVVSVGRVAGQNDVVSVKIRALTASGESVDVATPVSL